MRLVVTQLLCSLTLFLMGPVWAPAQHTGTITGTVTDAETDSPLSGATVRVSGTSRETATNEDGEFTFPAVPPGPHTVVIRRAEYKTVRRRDVEVISGLTRRVQFELQPAESEEQEMVVRSDESLMYPTAPFRVQRLGREVLKRLPTRSTETYYVLQPSVTLQNDNVHIRGGRPSETDFVVDGLSSRSVLGSDNVVPVIPEALEETQVLTGGSVTRGHGNGGVVQQTLRTGGESLSAMAQYEGDHGTGVFGDTYSYGDRDAVVTVGGPLYWDNIRFFVAGNYRETDNDNPLFWEGADLNEVAGPGPGLCGDVSAPDCHPPVDDVRGDTAVAPLQWDDGTVPGIGRPREEWRLNGTLTWNDDPLAVRLSLIQTTREQRDNAVPIENFYNQKRIQKEESLRRLVSLQPTYFFSDDTYLRGTFGLFQFEREQYDPLLGPVSERENGGLLPGILDYGDRQAVADALGLGTDPSALANNQYTRFWDGRFEDPRRYRFNSFTFDRPGAIHTSYSVQKQSYWKTHLELVSRQGSHEIRVGGNYKQWTIRNYSGLRPEDLATVRQNLPALPDSIAAEEPGLARFLRTSGVDYFGYDEFGHEVDSGPDGPKQPVTAAGWIGDNFEYEGLMVNAGLRVSYFDMDLWEPVYPADPPYDPIDAQVKVGGENGLQEASADVRLLPRLGLSYLLTNRIAAHFQFRQFAQMPDLRYAYAGRAAMAEVYTGDFFVTQRFAYDLDPIETTQYEVGIGWQLKNLAALNLSTHYRYTEKQLQIGRQGVEDGARAAAHTLFENGDHSIARGLEVSLRTKPIDGLRGVFHYSLNSAEGTNSEPPGKVAALENGTEPPSRLQPLSFMQKHQVSAVLSYWTGSDRSAWLQNWSATLLWQFSSGRRYTKSTGGIGLRPVEEGPLLTDVDPRNRIPTNPINASTAPHTSRLDLRVERGFTVGPATVTLYGYVRNLLNRRNAENVYLRTGSTTDDGFLSTPALSEDFIENRGQDFVEYYRAINLDNRSHYRDPVSGWGRDLLGEPRQIRFGIRVQY
jgi:hypothetical protein